MTPQTVAGHLCAAGCGRDVSQQSIGRPRLYCSPACQRAASRRRRYGLPI